MLWSLEFLLRGPVSYPHFVFLFIDLSEDRVFCDPGTGIEDRVVLCKSLLMSMAHDDAPDSIVRLFGLSDPSLGPANVFVNIRLRAIGRGIPVPGVLEYRLSRTEEGFHPCPEFGEAPFCFRADILKETHRTGDEPACLECPFWIVPGIVGMAMLNKDLGFGNLVALRDEVLAEGKLKANELDEVDVVVADDNDWIQGKKLDQEFVKGLQNVNDGALPELQEVTGNNQVCLLFFYFIQESGEGIRILLKIVLLASVSQVKIRDHIPGQWLCLLSSLIL